MVVNLSWYLIPVNKWTFLFPETEESRNYHSTDSSGFIPIIPSHHGHINPIFAQQNFFHSYFHSTPSTSRPFAFRHIVSSSTRFESSTPQYRDEDSILGSGHFTIMKGGRFYTEDEERDQDYYEEFYNANSGRPVAQPLAKKTQNPDDPFANFKDFADITAGVDTDFSHIVAVYANKNSTKHEPRNILEQLEMIDQEKYETEANESIKSAILSKFKTKLHSTKVEKEYKKFKVLKNPDYVDPLEADSWGIRA